MELDQLRIFVAVCKHSSFRAAANELSLAPSSVSRGIAALEHSLQTRLLQRSTRKQVLTAAGEQLLQRVEPMLEELDQLRDELHQRQQQPRGVLRVSASAAITQILLAPRLPRFCKQYPRIRIELITSDTRLDLLDGKFDLAVRHGHLPDSSLIAKKLAQVGYLCVASPKYLKAQGKPKGPQDLAKHNLISFPYPGFAQTWTFRRSGKAPEHIPVSPSLVASSALTLRSWARAGAGIATLPDWSIQQDLHKGRLVQLLGDWSFGGPSMGKHLWLLRPSRAFVPEKTRVFEEMLLVAVRALAASA